MNISRLHFSITRALCLALTLAVWSPAARGADGKAAPVKKVVPTGPSTNVMALLNAPVPQSAFADGGKEIKDPFFPRSIRLRVAPPPTNTTQPTVISSSIFSLKGISFSTNGTDSLALINNRTLAEGESSIITLDSGRKVKVKVVRIKEGSVTIQAEDQSETIELFPPQPKITRKEN